MGGLISSACSATIQLTKTQFTNYIQHFAQRHNYEWSCKIYREECWRVWSTKYTDIDPIFMINLGMAESQLKYWVDSSEDAHGPWQVQAKNWMHLLWYVDDGKFARDWRINEMSYEKRVSWFHHIPISFEMACIIMRANLKKYNGNYELALLAYWCGDSQNNLRFSWRRDNIRYWRNEDYYKRVFKPFPWWLFDPTGTFITPTTVD